MRTIRAQSSAEEMTSIKRVEVEVRFGSKADISLTAIEPVSKAFYRPTAGGVLRSDNLADLDAVPI